MRAGERPKPRRASLLRAPQRFHIAPFMFLPEPLRPLGLNAAVFALPMQADFSARSVWQFACPGAGEGHGAKAQAGIEMLRPLVGERPDDDRAAAGSAQTIDERRDDPGDHAPAPGGRKREEVLDHAPPLGAAA